MSKVFIIGANGKVGKNLVNVLNEKKEHDVAVGLRKEEQFSYFEDKGVQPIHLNLEDDIETITEAIKGFDIVVFTAGSGGHTGPDKTLMIDLDGAAKAVEASEKNAVKQFIMVSSIDSDRRDYWKPESMKPYFIAKHYADRILKESKLNYTILRPGVLSDEKGTGKITTDPSGSETSRIPREDVARVIDASIGNEKAYRKIVTLLEGDTPIETLYK
ncbi:SDR family oxidoreductase [Bacillus subtilis]|uniref:SDR family oxidoreductase n=1 Tax=Bacillus subtilis TaxID=1423 RepID=UPI002726A515|nr:SDR family oxidoreductase [Bacillus subtilis]MDP0484528.1 SDR family oxidoreductase [Bacillus subtilis]